MKYAVIQNSNGSFSVVSEHGDDLQAAIVAFHDCCKILWSAPDVINASVGIFDQNMALVQGKIEYIAHPVDEPESEVEND